MAEMNIFISALNDSVLCEIYELKSIPEEDHVFSPRFERKMDRCLHAAPGRAGLFAVKHSRAVLSAAAAAAVCVAVLPPTLDLIASNMRGMGGDMWRVREEDTVPIPSVTVDDDRYRFVQYKFGYVTDAPDGYLLKYTAENDADEQLTFDEAIKKARALVGSDTEYTPASGSFDNALFCIQKVSARDNGMYGDGFSGEFYSLSCLDESLSAEVEIYTDRNTFYTLYDDHGADIYYDPLVPAKQGEERVIHFSYTADYDYGKVRSEEMYRYIAAVEANGCIIVARSTSDGGINRGEQILCELLSAIV